MNRAKDWAEEWGPLIVVVLLALLLVIAVVHIRSESSAATAVTAAAQAAQEAATAAKAAVELAIKAQTAGGTLPETEAEAKKALARAMKRATAPEAPAEAEDVLANTAADSLIEMMKRDASGETARKVGRALKSVGSSEQQESYKEALPIFQDALNTAATKLKSASGGGATGALRELVAPDIGAIREGFWGGLGSLPWDTVTAIVGNIDFGDQCKGCCGCKKDADRQDDKNGRGGTVGGGHPPPGADNCEITPPKPCPACPKPATCPLAPDCPNDKRDDCSVTIKPALVAFAVSGQRDVSGEAAPIRDAAAALSADKTLSVVLWAFADGKGSELDNVRLARARAASVQTGLESQGVLRSRIRVAPMGEYLAPHDTSTGKDDIRNRVVRIQFVRSRVDAGADQQMH